MAKSLFYILLGIFTLYLIGYGLVRIVYSDKNQMQLSRGFPEEQIQTIYIPLIKIDVFVFGLQYWYEDGEPGPY